MPYAEQALHCNATQNLSRWPKILLTQAALNFTSQLTSDFRKPKCLVTIVLVHKSTKYMENKSA